MSVEVLLGLAQEAFLMAVIVAGPPLAAGLVVGVLVSVVQAVTQVNEMTLAFIPKIVAIMTAILVSMPLTIPRLTAFTVRVFSLIAEVRG